MSEPIAVWSGELSMAGVTLHVHVLSDGMRIIEAADLEALMEALQEGGRSVTLSEAAAFGRWQHGGELP